MEALDDTDYAEMMSTWEDRTLNRVRGIRY
jgi:hypothetical protein